MNAALWEALRGGVRTVNTDHFVTVATFNCEWRPTRSRDSALIRERVLDGGAEIVCLTEAYEDFFGDAGYTIVSKAPRSAERYPGRRTAILWSRRPWENVDAAGPSALPTAGFISGTTETAIGELTVFGICIPYHMADVRYGQPKRKLWEFHKSYLAAIDAWLPPTMRKSIVMGDFNQSIPRGFQPAVVFDALERTLLSRLDIATSGVIEPIGRKAIDHICHSRDLLARDCYGLSNIGPDGREISDHFGIRLTLEENAPD